MESEINASTKLYVKEEMSELRNELKADLKEARNASTRIFTIIASVIGLLTALGVWGIAGKALSDAGITALKEKAESDVASIGQLKQTAESDVGPLEQLRTGKWTPVKMEKVCALPFSGAQEYSHDIPAVIPKEAKEVLFYVYIRTGYVKSASKLPFKIYTQEKDKTKTYSIYFYSYVFNQDAFAYNSDNFWLPRTEDPNVYIERDGTEVNVSVEGELFVIGWR